MNQIIHVINLRREKIDIFKAQKYNLNWTPFQLKFKIKFKINLSQKNW